MSHGSRTWPPTRDSYHPSLTLWVKRATELWTLGHLGTLITKNTGRAWVWAWVDPPAPVPFSQVSLGIEDVSWNLYNHSTASYQVLQVVTSFGAIAVTFSWLKTSPLFLGIISGHKWKKLVDTNIFNPQNLPSTSPMFRKTVGIFWSCHAWSIKLRSSLGQTPFPMGEYDHATHVCLTNESNKDI